MRTVLAFAALAVIAAAAPATAVPTSGKNLGAVTGGEFTGNQIIDQRCVSCHSRQRIDDAVKQQKDMGAITRTMEQKGVRLTDKEREVLGIYWKQQTPFKSK